MPADVAAVDLDLALGAVARLIGAHALAQLVRQDEGGFVRDIEVTAELQGTHALGAIHEDRDGHEVVPDRQLAAVEDGAAGQAELF